MNIHQILTLFRKKLSSFPAEDRCRLGLFSSEITPTGNLLVYFLEDTEPTDVFHYFVDPPLFGKYRPAAVLLAEWLRVYPAGFEITIEDLAKTFSVCPKGVDPDTVPWAGEFRLK